MSLFVYVHVFKQKFSCLSEFILMSTIRNNNISDTYSKEPPQSLIRPERDPLRQLHGLHRLGVAQHPVVPFHCLQDLVVSLSNVLQLANGRSSQISVTAESLRQTFHTLWKRF